MQLTEIQIQQANDLIKRYGFPSLETQKQLQENGFFEKKNVSHYIVFPDDPPEISEPFVGVHGDIDYYVENDYDYILFPQFHEVWAVLPHKITTQKNNNKVHASLELTPNSIHYKYNSGWSPLVWLSELGACESACLLWLKLKKENLL